MRGWLALALAGAFCLGAPATALAQTASPPAKPYVVAIVPGHGGADSGAVFPADSSRPTLEEKNLTLPIALDLRKLLLSQDVRVVMTRTTDVTTTPEQRKRIAENAGADIFVAVHINSFFTDTSVRGAETEYFSDPRLSNSVADALVTALQPFGEDIRTTKDREQDNILSMPGVIVEAGYISNPTDRELIQRTDYQRAVAQGIYQGILTYAPQIERLKPRIEAEKAAHPARFVGSTRPSGGEGPNRPLLVVGAGAVVALLLAGRRFGRRPAHRRAGMSAPPVDRSRRPGQGGSPDRRELPPPGVTVRRRR
ncbi:MAG: N-acetylmuramoyl-L-alanine amidase family protein [Chloroflexota bacterium]